MANLEQNKEESIGSQRENQFVNLEQRKERHHTPSVMVESYHTERTERSHSRIGSHVSHDQETWKLQLEVDHLRKKLRRRERDRRDPSPPLSDGSGESKDCSYRHRSRTPSSESFSASSSQDKLEKGRYRCEQGSPHRSMGNDMLSKALRQISKSPFVRRINKARLPHQLSQPTFTIYNGRSNHVEHVSHFNQKMAVHSSNEALMCKIFPSSLGPVVMRWFDALEEGSIRSFEELTRAFGVRFVTCSRVPKPLDSLFSMAIREGETLKAYSDKYWETYNEINGDFEDVAIRTFKVGLPDGA